jgi:gluconolactonase
MERVQQHRFIDLVPDDLLDEASKAPKQRREFMRRSALAAFAASATAEAFAQASERYHAGALPTRYSELDVIGLDKRFKYTLGNTPILRLYRGTM